MIQWKRNGIIDEFQAGMKWDIVRWNILSEKQEEGMDFEEITLFLIIIGFFFTLGIVMVPFILRFYFGLLL